MKCHPWIACAVVFWGVVLQAEAGSLSDGLLLHYPFDRNEGTVLTDASGSGRFGWAHGASWVSDEERGGVFRFASNREYIVADDRNLPSGDSPRTMAMWIKMDAMEPDPVTALLTYGKGEKNHMSGIGMDWRGRRANMYFTQCGGVALSKWRMEKAGSWHHLAYAYEGKGRHRFYVDGVEGNGTSELWGPIDTRLSGAVIVGADPTGTGPASSLLDDVRIYDRALSAKEIAELAAAEEVEEPVLDLMVHYAFDMDEGGIVTDASGYGRTAQVVGATWVADGARGGAYRFDHNGQSILATDAGLPSGDAPRSMALWMKVDTDYENGCTGMLGYGTDNFSRQFSGIGFDWRLDRDRVYYSPGGACFLTERKLPEPGTWMHVAYTYGGNGSHHLFLDGEPSDGMSELWGPVQTLLSGTLRLGGHPGNPGPDGGYVDDVRIYGRELSAAEVAELAKADDVPVESGEGDGFEIDPGEEFPIGDEWGFPVGGYLEMRAIAKSATASGATVLQWASVPGKTYELQWTEDLTKGFRVLASHLAATGAELAFTNSVAGSNQAYYRVLVRE